MKTNVILMICIGLMTSVSMQAQTTKHSHPQLTASNAFLTFGRSITETNLMGQKTVVSNLPGINQNKFSAGFGGNVFFEKFQFGGEGSVHFVGQSNDIDYRSEVTSGYGLVTVGYIIKKAPKYMLYPSLGFGGGGAQYTYRTVSKIANTASNESGTTLKSGFGLLAMQMNADFYLEPNAKKGGLVLGLSMSYNWSPVASEWTDKKGMKPDEVSSYNKFDANGLHLNVKLGWGAKK